MYIYMYIYICIYIYTHIYNIYIHIYICYIYTPLYVCTCISMCVCKYTLKHDYVELYCFFCQIVYNVINLYSSLPASEHEVSTIN